MLGVDFGTTQSKIAYVDPSGNPAIILNDRGHAQTPSVVHVLDGREPLVGTDAVEQGYVDPAQCLRNFKPRLGTQDNLLRDGRVVNATDAAAMVIAYLKQQAEATLGMAVKECVATCPANFRDHSKQALLEAFERNELKVLALIPEPTAAGSAYALEKARSECTSLVYDFGGGTLDVSALKTEGPQITVLATEGVPDLGGNSLNEPLRQLLMEKIVEQFGAMPTPEEDPMLYQELDTKTEAAKISLGKRAHVPCVVGHKGSQVVVELTQEAYHRLIDPLVAQSLDAMDRAVQAAGLTYQDISSLLMVGGTSRFPYIQQVVARHTGLTPKTDIDPEKTIAYGAALACVAEMAKQGRTATIRGQVIPDPAMFVLDVTAHAVGCCVADNTASGKQLVNAVLIPKNTPIPCRKTHRFYLEHEDQVAAHIEILQGEPNALRDDCLVIGDLTLDHLPKEAKRTERIQVEYIVDRNGMVTATGLDTVSGTSRTVSVDYKKGIKAKDKLPAA